MPTAGGAVRGADRCAGGGHFVPFEASAEFLSALASFLERSQPSHTTEQEYRELLVGNDMDRATQLLQSG